MNVVRSSTARVGRRWPLHALGAVAAIMAAGTAKGESSVYVVNVASNDVSVIDTTSNTVVATIAVGPQPNGVAVTPNGERIYVSNFQADTVSVIDAATRTVVGTIAVGEEPVGIAVSPDGAKVYVANRGSSSVSVIDSATDQVVATVTDGVGPGSNGIALSPDGTRAYVNNAFSRDPGTVSVIDSAAATVVDTIEVARNPKRIAIAPDGLTGYVANFRSWNISIVDLPSNTLRDALRVSGRTVGVAVHPNGQYAYITNLDGTVEILETSNGLLTVPIAVGGEPYAIALSGQGGTAYVANLADDTVSVVDLGADVEVTRIPVGDKPFAIAWGCRGEECSLPPFTPKPTRTSTPTPTITETATITPTSPPTPTRPPNANAVHLIVSSPGGEPGARVEMDVTLDARGQHVSGVQLDLAFDPRVRIAALANGLPDCTANPETNKDAPAAFLPPGCSGDSCTGVRILVISIENLDVIPDGLRLLSCRIAIAADTPLGTYPLSAFGADSSDPGGNALDTVGVSGAVTVRAAARSQRQVADNGRRCSGGLNDGRRCEGDDDCLSGPCVMTANVCDGGADDGLLCGCPGGECVGEGACATDGSGGTCSGGRDDGRCCDRDFDCSGGRPCTPTQKLCADGVDKGQPCLRDEHCTNSECVSAGLVCRGGGFDRFACLDDRDCPLGACVVPPTPNIPGMPDGEPVDVPQGGSGGGCAIDQSAAPLNAWTMLLPLALTAIRRRRSP
jgi:YVTN family beta-propeller protein